MTQRTLTTLYSFLINRQLTPLLRSTLRALIDERARLAIWLRVGWRERGSWSQVHLSTRYLEPD